MSMAAIHPVQIRKPAYWEDIGLTIRTHTDSQAHTTAKEHQIHELELALGLKSPRTKSDSATWDVLGILSE